MALREAQADSRSSMTTRLTARGFEGADQPARNSPESKQTEPKRDRDSRFLPLSQASLAYGVIPYRSAVLL